MNVDVIEPVIGRAGGARRQLVLADERASLEADEPHATVRKLTAELAARGIKTCRTTVSSVIVRQDLRFPSRVPARCNSPAKA